MTFRNSDQDSWITNRLHLNVTQDEFNSFKTKVLATKDIESFLKVMYSQHDVMNILCSEFADLQLSEIAAARGSTSPLNEFPPDQSDNIYSRILNYCMEQAPRLTSHMTRMVVRPDKSITPTDVLRVASAVGQICYLADRNLNGLAKLRALTLQTGGLSNEGIDVLAKLGITGTSGGLCKQKDMFAEVGPKVMAKMASKLPTRRLHDNVDWQSQHLMLECIAQETVDTSNLSTTPMPKEDAVRLITPELLLLNSPANIQERDELLAFLVREWAAVLGERREESAAILAKLLPRKSKLSGQPAMLVSVHKLHPCRETSHADMLTFLMKVQGDHLEQVAVAVNSESFRADLKLLQDAEVEEEVREAAELRVHLANLEYGEMIGHGDQLTVETWQVCKGVLAQNVTAFGRGEYLGIYQLEGMHSKMTKLYLDLKAMMKNETNFQDECSIAKLVALVGQTKDIHNNKNKIIKSDSSFERHDQMFTEIGKAYGLNMWDNHIQLYPERLARIKTEEEAKQYVLDMWDDFGVTANIFYNPSEHDPTQMDESEPKQEDDLFINCRVGFLRWVVWWIGFLINLFTI